MYGEKSSLVSQNAISALHPNVKALIYSESLFSPEEEKLISTVKNVSNHVKLMNMNYKNQMKLLISLCVLYLGSTFKSRH